MNSLVKAVVLVVVALAGVQGVDERTVSGLAQLISPGAQGPYPAAGGQAAPYPGATATQSYAQSWDYQPSRTPQGFTVQSGYEGIIAPTGPESDGFSTLQKIGGVALGTGLGASLLSHILPFPFNRIVHFLTTKIGVWIGGFALLLLLGGAATTAVCALTPICTISFLGFRLNKENVRSLLSQDRIDSITQFVHDAIDKYKKIQNREGKAFVNKPENKGKKPKHAKENKIEEDVKEKKEKKEVKETTQEVVTEANREAKILKVKETTQEVVTEANREAKILKVTETSTEKENKETNEVPKEDTK